MTSKGEEVSFKGEWTHGRTCEVADWMSAHAPSNSGRYLSVTMAVAPASRMPWRGLIWKIWFSVMKSRACATRGRSTAQSRALATSGGLHAAIRDTVTVQ